MSRRAKNKPRAAPAREAEAVYGIRPVEAALEARRRTLHGLFMKGGRLTERIARIASLAKNAGIPVEEKSNEALAALCGSDTHQGVVLRAGALPFMEVRACLKHDPGDRPLLVALDQVEDPQNLGAIARSAAVFGAAGLVLPRHGSAPLSAAASKASAGHLESLPVCEVPNLARFLQQSRRSGFWVVGASSDEGQPLGSYQRDSALIVVLGSEGKGLRPLVATTCDLLLRIPTPGADSLNVSAAAAVFLYHLAQDG